MTLAQFLDYDYDYEYEEECIGVNLWEAWDWRENSQNAFP